MIRFLVSRILWRRLLREPLSSAVLLLSIAIVSLAVSAVLQASRKSVDSFQQALAPLAAKEVFSVSANADQDFAPHIRALSTLASGHFQITPFRQTQLVLESPNGTTRSISALSIRRAKESVSVSAKLSTLLKEGWRFRDATDFTHLDVVPLDERETELFEHNEAVLLLGSSHFAKLSRSRLVRYGYVFQSRIGTIPDHILAKFAEYLLLHAPRLQISSLPRSRQQAEKLLSAFSRNIHVLMISAVLVTAFVIFQLVQIRSSASLQSFVTLRTLGVSRSRLSSLILLEGAVFGLLGGALGLLLFAPLGDAIVGIFTQATSQLYLGEAGESQGFQIRGFELLLCLASSIILGVVGSFAPLLRARQLQPGITPVRLLSGERARGSFRRSFLLSALLLALSACLAWIGKEKGTYWFAYAAVFCLLPLAYFLADLLLRGFLPRSTATVRKVFLAPGLIAQSNIICAGTRSAYLIALCALSFSLVYGMSVLISSFRSTLQSWMETSLQADIYIQSREVGRLSMVSDEAIAALREHPSALHVSTVAFDQSEVAGLPVRVVSVRPSSFNQYSSYPTLDGRGFNLESARSEAVVSEAMARKHELSVGSSFLLRGELLTVVGVIQDFSSEHGVIFLDRANASRLGLRVAVSGVSVYLDPDASPQDFILESQGKSWATALEFLDNATLKANVEQAFEQTFAITLLLRGIVLAVCIVGFAAVFYQELWQRAELNESLTRLGMSRTQMSISYFIEAFILSVPSVGLGAALGSILGFLLLEVITPLSFGWTVGSDYLAARELVNLASIVMLAALLAAVLPALKFQSSLVYSGSRE